MTKVTKSSIGCLGVFLCIASLIVFLFLKLPFNFSVACGNVNEGFYFVNGQLLLEGKKLYTDIFISRGPLFFLIYAAVLKLFGFGTWSIIAVHVLQKIIILLIGIMLFLFVSKLFQNISYASLCVLFWFLLQFIPVGGWGSFYEIESALALEAEFLCVLFSLLSLYFLLKGFSKKKAIIFSLISGLLATCSMMFKANGAVLVIAFFCWIVYLLSFDRKELNDQKDTFIYFFVGFLFSFLISNVVIYLHNHDLSSFWYSYFFVGSYKHEGYKSFVSGLLTFMFRDSNSYSNFWLFFIAFLSFGWGLIRNNFLKADNGSFKSFYPLLSIWSVGNVCSVIAIGQYASYYYIIVWPSVAISLALVLRDLFTHVPIFHNKAFKSLISILILLFFLTRCVLVLPGYNKMIKESYTLSFDKQPESFQDPVLASRNSLRPVDLKVADLINSYLPDKNDTFYVFNFSQRHQVFSPFIYIYAKRLCASSIVSDWLYVQNSIDLTTKMLMRDFRTSPPKIIIMLKSFSLKPWQIKALEPLFTNLNLFLEENYHLKKTFEVNCCKMKKSEIHIVWERN